MRQRNLLIPVLSSLLVLAACGRGPGRPFTVVSWGGALQDAEREAYFQPFGKLTGKDVRDIAFTGEYARLKAMVESGKVEWDVVETDSDIVLSGGKEGLFEPIDYSVVPRDKILTGWARTYGVGVFLYSTVLMWNNDRIPKAEPRPSKWADLWDTKRYPGKRGFRKSPRTTLEIALLADGVAPQNLYPLDVDRAFRKLDQIRKDIVWWSSGAELEAKMLDELTMAAGYNGRAFNLQQAGKNISYTFDGAILDSDWWVVPRGTPYRQLAMQFIAYTCRPEGQRLLARRLAYGPIIKGGTEGLPPSVEDILASTPQNLRKEVRFSSEWWAENQKAILPRWEAWLIEGKLGR